MLLSWLIFKMYKLKELDDFREKAQALAWKMHEGKWQLPMLDDMQCNYLGKNLFDLSPKGFAKGTFQRIFQRPTEAQARRETVRLYKGLKAVSAIASADTPACKEALESFLRDIYYNDGLAAYQAVANLLTETARLQQFLPAHVPYVDTDADRTGLTIQRDYKTYAIGFELPSMFAELYPGVKFGTQNAAKETYEGAGVDFTLACCKAIDFGTVNVNNMRKMIDRAKGFGITRFGI